MKVGNQLQLRSLGDSAFSAENPQLARLIDHLPGMAYRYRYDGGQWVLEFVSAGSDALTGYRPADLVGDRRVAYAALIHPEDREEVLTLIQQALHDQQAYNCVYRIFPHGGVIRWVRDQGVGVFSETGDLLFREGFISDISEEKQREEILIHSDEQAERFVQSIQDGVFLIQGDFLQFVNSALAEMVGFTVDEMVGQDFRTFIIPEDVAGIPAYYRRLHGDMGASTEYELQLLHKDGVTHIPVHVNLVKVNYRGSGILGTVKDVSLHRRVERERIQLLERVDRQHRTVIRLSKHPAVAEGRLDEALPLIAEEAARTLQVEQVSIWRLSPGDQECRRLAIFVLSSGELLDKGVLRVADYLACYQALREGLVLDIADVVNDPRTKALAERYWAQHNISSALQAPILMHGQVIGVVCHAHAGLCREWMPDEVAFASQVADLVAQTFLNADVRRRTHELTVITRVSREISAKRDLQQVLDSIAQHAAELLNADTSTVFVLQQDGEIALASHGLTRANMQTLRAASDGFLWKGGIGRALVERRPIQVYDTSSEKPPVLQGLMRKEGIRSELVVPMLKEKEVVGGIMLGHRQPRYFSEQEVEFVQALAQQSVNAVESARLLGLERSLRRRAEALYGLAHLLIDFDRLPDLLRAVVGSVTEVLNARWAMLVTLDVDRRQILDCVTSGTNEARHIPPSFAHLWDGAIGEVWRTGASIVSNERDNPYPGCDGACSVVIVPLQYQNEMIGTLTAIRPTGQPAFQDQDVALMSAMANQTAAAIQNFRLLDSLNLEKIRLELLYRLGQHLSKSLDVHDVCQLALDEVVNALEAFKGLVLVLGLETETMQLEASVGYKGDAIAKLRKPHYVGVGLNDWVMQHRQSVVVDDVAIDSRWLKISGVDDDMQSALSVPLLSGEMLVGVITLASPHKAFFTAEHCRLVESAAATIAIAVNNALLFSRAQQHASEQECISDIARALNAHSVARAFSVLVRGLQRLIGSEQVVLALWDEKLSAFSVAASTIPALATETALTLSETVEALLLDVHPYLTVDLTEAFDAAVACVLPADGIHSHVLLPLSIGRQVTGLLYLGSGHCVTASHLPTLQQIADTVAIAVENDRLFQAEQRQREVAERLQETALVVNTLDLQEVLKLIMDRLESILPYRSGTIQILEQGAMRVIAVRGLPEDFVGRRYVLETHLYNRRLANGEVVVIEDVLENDESFLIDPDMSSLRSNIGVPLWVRDKVIGALTIDNNEVGSYTEEDIRVIRVFAQQAAIAIENARLFEAQRVQRELAEALGEAAAVMSSVLDFDQVLDHILDQVARVVHGDTFNIILVEGTAGRMIRWRGYDELGIPSTPASREDMSINYPSLLKMLRDGKPTYIGNVRKDPNWVPVPGREKLYSYVAAPIRIAGKTEGFLNVAGVRPNQFGPQDAQRLKVFADQAAIALQNARLFQQTVQYAEELERRVRERTIQLEAKNAWLEAIVSSTSDGIIVTDGDGHIVDANRVAEMWLHHSLPAEDAERLRKAIRDLARRGHMRPDAVLELTGLDLELRAAPILEQGSEGPAVVVGVHDVSYLKALDRMKTQFVSNVSHELRTPITSIRLYSSLLQRGSEARRQQYFVALDQEAERLSKLVEDILRISRIEGGQLELERRRIDLNLLTETAVLSHKALAESRGLTVVYKALNEEALISADPDKFIQVLNNLIENAMNYTLGEGSVEVATKTQVVDGRNWATVVVQDTGLGIPEGEIDHLFERFFRGAEPQERRIQGSGLGLAIVKEIVELHGGMVKVDSQVGVGSTFAVWMPLIED